MGIGKLNFYIVLIKRWSRVFLTLKFRIFTLSFEESLISITSIFNCLFCYIIAYNSGFYSFDSKYRHRNSACNEYTSVSLCDLCGYGNCQPDAVYLPLPDLWSSWKCNRYGDFTDTGEWFYHEHLLSEEVQY